MTEDLVVTEIKTLIGKHSWKEISQRVSGWPDPEVADLLLHLEKTDRVLLYRSLHRKKAADVFAHLDHEHQDSLLQELGAEDTRHLLANLSPDDRTSLLEELPAQVTQRLLQLLSPEDMEEARQLLGYPEESIGRLMTPDYVAVRPDITVAEALDSMRRAGKDRETFNIIHVTDPNGKLLDSLRLRRFILADPNATVESIMDFKFVSLSAFDDREQAVRMIRRYDLYALPVVDSDGILMGIVTMDDVMDVAEEEVTEDFHKAAAVSPLDMPYSRASSAFLYRKRIGWLTVLLGVNLISAIVVVSYEETLEAFLVLATFMPLVVACGGNAGAQSATLMVRALATGDVKPNLWIPPFLKELAVGGLLAVSMGVLSYALGFYRGGADIGLVIGISMVAIIIIANLIGVVLPFTLTKFKMDPAVASSPLITSLMDAIGLLIYFWMATKLLDLV